MIAASLRGGYGGGGGKSPVCGKRQLAHSSSVACLEDERRDSIDSLHQGWELKGFGVGVGAEDREYGEKDEEEEVEDGDPGRRHWWLDALRGDFI